MTRAAPSRSSCRCSSTVSSEARGRDADPRTPLRRPAYAKAAHFFDMELVQVPLDANWRADVDAAAALCLGAHRR